MRAEELQDVRRRLLERRRAVLVGSLRAGARIGELRGAERDPEVEEGSQSEQIQYDLAQLGEVERGEVARIDAALQRLQAGAYGVCRDCGEAIEAARLAALPFALECVECAGRREEDQALDREAARKARPMSPE